MAQIHLTLNQEEILEVLTKNRDEAFRMVVEKVLNQILRSESAEQLGAEPYERTGARTDSRNGTRERTLTTRIGTITLDVPRHRNVPFRSMIFDNYSRAEATLIAAMVEMVVNGVSTRKISRVTEMLCGKSFSKSAVSELCGELDGIVNGFRDRPLERYYPFLITDATYFRVREDHRVVSKALLVAMGIREDGIKEIIGFHVCDGERNDTWEDFYRSLTGRGLRTPLLITSDAHAGEKHAISTVFPTVPWQRCQVHFRKNILDRTPEKHKAGLGSELGDMFQARSMEEARGIRDRILADYSPVAEKAMEVLDSGFEEAMTVMAVPEGLRRVLRTSNHLERHNGELKARANVIKIFPNAASVNRLMGAVIMESHDAMVMRRQGVFTPSAYKHLTAEYQKELLQKAREQYLGDL